MNDRARVRPRPGEVVDGRMLADLHAHTSASDGKATVQQTLAAANRLGWLDVIAITDHDTIAGGLEAARVASGDGLAIDVIVGEEVTTRGGHLLGLYLTEAVRPRLAVADAVRAIHDQGGIAIPAHPLFPYHECIDAGTIRRVAEDPRTRVDALEAHNPTALGRLARTRIRALAAELDIALVGGSDSHKPGRIGTAWTAFAPGPGGAAAALRLAVEARATSSGGRDDPLLAGIPLALGQAAGAVRHRLRGTR